MDSARCIVITLVTVALFTGCAGDRGSRSSPAASPGEEPAAGESQSGADAATLDEPKYLIFINSRVFDTNLSKAMGSQHREIVVEVASRFSLDVLPERVEGWLLHIQKSDGRVEAQAMETELAMRGVPVVELLELALAYREKAQKKAETEARYAPANEYHARLYYQRESGAVDRLVFYRR